MLQNSVSFLSIFFVFLRLFRRNAKSEIDLPKDLFLKNKTGIYLGVEKDNNLRLFGEGKLNIANYSPRLRLTNDQLSLRRIIVFVKFSGVNIEDYRSTE